MPIDPSIALSVRQPQMPDPLESYMRLMQIQGMKDQQKLNAQMAPLHLQQQQQQVDAGQLELEQKKRTLADMDAMDKIMSAPNSRESILGNPDIPFHQKQLLEKQFSAIDEGHAKAIEASAKADEARTEMFGRGAATVRDHNYDPASAQGVVSYFKSKFGDDPSTMQQLTQFEEQLKANPTPETVKALIDPLIAASSQRKVDVSQTTANARMISAQNPTQAKLATDAVSGGPTAPQSAAALAAMKSSQQQPKGKWVADYDENGKPIERWVAEGPGVVVPRAAPRPVVMAPGSIAVDPSTGATVAQGNPQASQQRGKWVADYDENGKPVERWMAEGPGAVVPRQEAAPRPIIVGPNAKAVNPATGEVIAEGNAPTARTPAVTKVDTLNDQGQPVTKFVEPTAGQEFIKQTEEKLTRPREVRPGSEEAFVIAYAKKLGKRPDDLTIDDQMKVRQAWARADDKAPGVADDVVPLSEAGLNVAAKRYNKDGTLPPLSMGLKGAREKTRIVNRAAELDPEADIASNKAGYKADSAALTQLQKQRDAIGAFEQTAGKNIDVFLKTAGKVVDTGSPMANTVVRMVSGKMLGSPDQAAYDAARQVAVNEIAKITSNPNLSGSLSDSARHEVDAFNPQSATLKQTVAVMRLLKNDMQNRTSSMDEQIKSIQARIKGSGGAAAQPAAPAGLKSDPLGIR